MGLFRACGDSSSKKFIPHHLMGAPSLVLRPVIGCE
jgi:hypothetical protein